ncbi:uncharacterized protein SRS1_16588 [Sporisorium reilianum f. sp. reilianum]|uniref:Zn(2)-C6 fungal-type domain-containing protein n=1 Tax=Sporisorium reilianum f. sp. reilianum TaxID=72559 RepID=A0A2N8UD20_9BASI|nr:uncharacterized protein SRS1_16588 [Sporisorium reilianum f. sp. reilianum]
MSALQSTPSMSAPSSTAMRSASASNDTSPPAKSNSNDDADKPKRTQTCFRCRQSKVKCVFEGDNAASCRRCLRLGVNCELQGKKEPLSWQMRVQHQLAALEGSLQTFLEKQMAGGSASQQSHGDAPPFEAHGGNKRSSFPRSRDSPSAGVRMYERDGASKKRRRTIASDQRSANDMQQLAYSSSSHSHTGESPIYADVNSGSTSSYPSATHLSPRDAERAAGHAADASANGLLGSLVASVAQEASTSLHGDHALPDDDGVTTTAERGAFQTDDEHDQASRPLSAIQKLRMSVLDRKKEHSRSGERVFPNLYRMATSDVGSKDPRPNVIKQDLVSPSDAVVLFRFFADYLDQYSFGFPTYRPDAIMSPMILTSVVCVASLHHAQLNRLHVPLKRDLIARLQTDDPSFPCSDVYETLFSSSSASRSSHLQSNVHFEKELDPELGIGVEEIVGASLFAAWFGGKRAWMASRLARWWSAKFLRQQQHPAMMTMGEIMSILPPPRDLGKQDLLRVWLSAYITEIHQACMEGTPSIAGLSSPHAVCDSLQYAKGLSQRTTLRDRVLIIHSRIAWILSKAYHIAGSGSAEHGKGDRPSTTTAASNDSPSRSCPSCRDGYTGESGATGGVAAATDAASCLHAVLGAFEELDSCQDEMAGRLDAEAIGESETMLYLDLFLARVLIASIGCDFLDSTLWDGSLGQISAHRTRAAHYADKTSSSEADLQSLRSRTLRESLTRGVEGAMRSLELVCLPGMGMQGAAGGVDVSLNVLVLPLWFHWALTRSVLFLMNVLAEYPERLLPRDRSRSIELITMFLDLYSKHIGHANMVLGHHHRSVPSEGAYGGNASWSPSASVGDGRGDHRHGANGSGANGGPADAAGAAAAGASANGAPAAWQSSQEMIQHPATPLLDTLSQCLTWARHGGVM